MAQYRRVTYADRCQIHACLQAKLSVESISKDLGFHRSTIFREIGRNRTRRGYRAQLAQLKYHQRFRNCRRPYLISNDIEGRVLNLLFNDLSPQQISARLRHEKAGDISHQAIYDYTVRNEGLRAYLRRYNRRGASRLRMTAHKQEGKVSIDLRPKESNLRTVIGHWERDCLYAANQQRILVCVDRKSRYAKIAKLEGNTVKDVTRLTNKLLRKAKRKAYSITNDNGPEFRHPDGAVAPVYYCHPRRPQERGTVENLIGFVRQYIKRKTDLKLLTPRDIQCIENKLNFRPRKCLDYKTPYEVFYGKSVALAI